MEAHITPLKKRNYNSVNSKEEITRQLVGQTELTRHRTLVVPKTKKGKRNTQKNTPASPRSVRITQEERTAQNLQMRLTN